MSEMQLDGEDSATKTGEDMTDSSPAIRDGDSLIAYAIGCAGITRVCDVIRRSPIQGFQP